MTFEEQLKTTGRLIYTVKGISMLPMLRQRQDIVVIEDKPYGMRDVVLFRRREPDGRISYVLHRIVKKYADGSYLIWGDNTFTGDRVQREDILGVLTAFVRDGKTVKVTDPGYRLYVCFYGSHYKLRVFMRRVRAWAAARL